MEKLIVELANKFEVTTEQLWNVLIKQAYITGIINFLLIIALVCLTQWAFKFIKHKTIEEKIWEDEGYFCAWLFWGILLFITIICISCELPITIGALINPKFWALKQILGSN